MKSIILLIVIQFLFSESKCKRQIFMRKENTQAPIITPTQRLIRVDPEYDDNLLIPESQIHLAKPIEHRTHQRQDHMGNIVKNHVTMQRNAHGRVTSFSKMQTTNGHVDFVHHRHIGKRLL